MGSLTDLQCPQCVCTASLSPAYEDGEEHGGRPNSRICLKQPGSFLLLGLGSSGDPEGGQMLGGPEILLRIWRGKIPRRSGKNLAAASFSYHTGWCIQEPPPKAAPPRTCPEDLWSTGDAGMRGPDSLHQGCATARAPAAWKPDLWPDDPNLRLPAGTSRPGWLEGRCSPQLTQVSHPRRCKWHVRKFMAAKSSVHCLLFHASSITRLLWSGVHGPNPQALCPNHLLPGFYSLLADGDSQSQRSELQLCGKLASEAKALPRANVFRPRGGLQFALKSGCLPAASSALSSVGAR
ncbi:uncharacterized protein [Struthio camelus]|uniref:uncharacterized protein isoform X3 n=1 Tax=Struthio camelus TaxID=8801 RepID=UPI003604299B